MSGKERELTLRFLAEPKDVNFGGKVHGGAAMKWIDLAAYGCSAAWSGRYCITAYVGGMRFVKPILVGNIVEVHAKVIYTGRTSMHLGISVSAGDPTTTDREVTTHCIAVMVAVDSNGKPVEIPAFVPETDEDKQLWDSAKRLISMRESSKS